MASRTVSRAAPAGSSPLAPAIPSERTELAAREVVGGDRFLVGALRGGALDAYP